MKSDKPGTDMHIHRHTHALTQPHAHTHMQTHTLIYIANIIRCIYKACEHVHFIRISYVHVSPITDLALVKNKSNTGKVIAA